MEVFNFINLGELIVQYFLLMTTGTSKLSLQAEAVCLAIGSAIYVACLVLGGIGLYKMAKNAGMRHKALGFLPFANTYYAGKLAGDIYVLKTKTKRWPLYAMLCEMLYVACGIFRIVLFFILTSSVPEGTEITVANVPGEVAWMIPTVNVVYIVEMIVSAVLFVLFVFVYMALFRKYSPRNAVWMTLLVSLFPFRAFLIFAVRNNAPQDYNEYLRRMMAQYGASSQYGSPTSPQAGGTSSPDPFGEMRQKPENTDPFADLVSDAPSTPKPRTDDGKTDGSASGTDAPSDGEREEP